MPWRPIKPSWASAWEPNCWPASWGPRCYRRLKKRFHWHAETFALPNGAVHLTRSDACENQAFIYQDRIIGLQYHLEATPDSLRALIDNCAADMVSGRFVQSATQMLSVPERYGPYEYYVRSDHDLVATCAQLTEPIRGGTGGGQEKAGGGQPNRRGNRTEWEMGARLAGNKAKVQGGHHVEQPG